MELSLKQTNKILAKQMPSATVHMIHLKENMTLFEGIRDFFRKRTKEKEWS